MNTDRWVNRFQDQRSHRVMFLAHCLLNENTRDLGGACQPAMVREAVEFCLAHDVAIVQLPCPEQHAWGGVLKRRLLRFYGVEGSWRSRAGQWLFPVMWWWTRRIYRALARRTVAQVADYEASGMTVLAIVGVDGSPSCGVSRRLDARTAFKAVARLQQATATSDDVNNVIRACQRDGAGDYVVALSNGLDRRRLHVPFMAHDLIAELDGDPLPLREQLQSAWDRISDGATSLGET